MFINNKDVSRRCSVVHVGGVDVSALQRDLNGKENGLMMMMLQIVDTNKSQNWINVIKNTVLGQRYIYTQPLCLPLLLCSCSYSCRPSSTQ